MRKAVLLLVFVSLFIQPFVFKSLFAADDKFGIGIKAGINKLEGDWLKPRFNPMGSFVLSYSPIPYFAIGAEVNYSALMTRSQDDVDRLALSDTTILPPRDANKFQTTAMPIELDFKFSFSPRTTVNPFATIGIGGVSWNAMYDGQSQQNSFDLLFKASGGVELNFDNGLGVAIGASYRYTGSDVLDQRATGDKNDGLTSIWAGLNYYITKKDPLDLDGDYIPKQLDLDLYRPEDRNGFWDHDGKPDNGKPAKPSKAPTVIHYPVFRAEAGRDLKIDAIITSEVPIRTATVIYRTTGTGKWKLAPLKNIGDISYEAVINGAYVTTTGLEYCVVAVDTDLKGIGYSGLPKRPIQVKVEGNGKNWRIVSGIAAFFGWGAATYIVLRKQNTN